MSNNDSIPVEEKKTRSNALTSTSYDYKDTLLWQLRNKPVRPRGRLRGRVGGDTQLRPKPRLITSPDRPGLPNFSRGTLKNMGRPGYEAKCEPRKLKTQITIQAHMAKVVIHKI